MGDFLRHLLLRPMGVQKAVSAEQRSSRLRAPLARYRPEQPFPSCVPAELESVFPGTDESTTFQRLLPNHWTQERMPAKIRRPVPRSKDRNRTSPLPLKSKKNHFFALEVNFVQSSIVGRFEKHRPTMDVIHREDYSFFSKSPPTAVTS